MLLLHLSDVDEASWAEALRAALGSYRVVRRGDDFDPAEVRYILVWKQASMPCSSTRPCPMHPSCGLSTKTSANA